MKGDMRGILWGTVFNVTEPTKAWNAVLIKMILEELGGMWCEDFEPNPNWERVFMYVRDDSMRIVVNHYEQGDVEDQCIKIAGTGFIRDTRVGIPSSFVVSGLNDWAICSRWLCSDAAKEGFLRNPTDEPMPTYMDTQSIDSIFHGFVCGITSYAKWYSKHYAQEMLVDTSMVKFAFSNPSNYQVYFMETAVMESTECITIGLGIFGRDITCNMSSIDGWSYSLDMPRWNSGEVDVDYDVHSVRDIYPHITPAKRYYQFMGTPVHILTVADPNHNAVTYSYITNKVKGWAEARGISGYHYLKTTPYPIYINEHKSKQVNNSVKSKNNTKMSETKKSSFMEKMMARFKGQFVPEKCEDFAITYDGNLVAKCKAGSEIIYNAIVDDAVVSYPEEAVWNIPMFTILRPAEKICVNDIICISGPTTASRFGKVTEIQRTGAGVKSFKVIRFNGTEDGSVVTKDAIMKQGLVETIFNPFDPNNNIFEGFNIPGMSGSNPLMGIMMMKVLTGDSSNSDDMIEKMCMMGLMNGNNMLMGNSNPLMAIMMMKTFTGDKGGSDDMMSMLFMSSMLNGNNPFANMFQQAQPSQPTRKVRSDKGTKKTKPVETSEEDIQGDNPQDNE